MTAVRLDGREFVTSGEVCKRLAPDVTPETLRNWTRPQRGKPPRLRPVLDPNTGEPAEVDGQYVYVWAEVLEAEKDTGASGKGRPRAQGVRR